MHWAHSGANLCSFPREICDSRIVRMMACGVWVCDSRIMRPEILVSKRQGNVRSDMRPCFPNIFRLMKHDDQVVSGMACQVRGLPPIHGRLI